MPAPRIRPPLSGLFYAQMTTDLAVSPATQTKPRRPTRHYDEAHVQAGLTQIALNAGNHRNAHKALAAMGYHIPPGTLEDWKNRTHADRYQQVRDELVPQVHARIAEECEDNARLAAEIEALALEATRQQLATGDLKDASSAARNMATVRGINIDKASLLRGRPTSIVETRDATEVLRSLAAQIPDLQPHINSTATEEQEHNGSTTEQVLSSQSQAQGTRE